MLRLDLEILQVQMLLHLFSLSISLCLCLLVLIGRSRDSDLRRDSASLHHLGIVADVRDGWRSALLHVVVKKTTATTGQSLEMLEFLRILTLHRLKGLCEAIDGRRGEGEVDHFNQLEVRIQSVGIDQTSQQVMDGLHTILERGVAEDLVDEVGLQLEEDEGEGGRGGSESQEDVPGP
jgi:hypothetical protein